jgi:hypothetical protein
LTLSLLLASIHHFVHVFPEIVRDGQVFVHGAYRLAQPYLRSATRVACQLLSIWSQLTLAFVWRFGELCQCYFEKTKGKFYAWRAASRMPREGVPMAAAASGSAPLGGDLPAVGQVDLRGQFLLVPGITGEYDEVFVCSLIVEALTQGRLSLLCLTTAAAAPHQLIWVEASLAAGSYRVMCGWGEDRSLPMVPPMDPDSVNFMCKPEDLNLMWFVTAAERVQIVQEAEVSSTGLSELRAQQRRAGGDLPQPWPLVGHAPAEGRPGPAVQVGGRPLPFAGGMAMPQAGLPAPGTPVGGAMGLGFGQAVGGEDRYAEDLRELKHTLQDFKLHHARGRDTSIKKAKKDKDEKKTRKDSTKKGKKEKNDGKKKKKKSQPGVDSSGTSSSTSSASSSAGSSEEPGERFLQWVWPKQKSREIHVKVASRMTSMRFKRRSDLINFAERYPGALGALFLSQVREKVMAGSVVKTGDLYSVDPQLWATSMSGLKEIRDIREVQLLCRLIVDLNNGRHSRAMDTMTMRIREIKAAKSQGSSWEKASVLSLLSSDIPNSTSLPDNGLAL